MDWNLAMEEKRRVLKRIVALLFAFADLAERLSTLPRPVRGFVLCILRRAEAVAREFVLDMVDDQGVPVPLPACLAIPALQGGDSPADALRLARSFRLFARLLDRLAGRDRERHKRRAANRCGTSATGLPDAFSSLLAQAMSGPGGVRKPIPRPPPKHPPLPFAYAARL